MGKYDCLIFYILLVNAFGFAQERKETVTAFEYSAEENYKRIGGADTNESAGPLITGVDAMKLLESVVPGYKEDPNSRRRVSSTGVRYLLRKKEQTDKRTLPVSFSVGVFETEKKLLKLSPRKLRWYRGR